MIVELADLVVEGLKPIQKEYKGIISDKDYIERVLREGAEKVRPIAEEKLKIVKDKIGLG